MKQPRTKLARLIADKTLAGGSSKKFDREIAAYLLGERRTSELNSVLRDVQADWAEAGHVEVIARSAHSLTASAKADIIKRIKPLYPNAQRLIVTEVHDPTIIGGVRLNLADRQLDLSIRSKLDTFKQLATAGKD
jgi:F0F1-type ATP synthase delta subunit